MLAKVAEVREGEDVEGGNVKTELLWMDEPRLFVISKVRSALVPCKEVLSFPSSKMAASLWRLSYSR